MSEELTITDDYGWENQADREFWLGEVTRYAESRASEGITKAIALELRDPNLAARALFMVATRAKTKKAICEELGIHSTELWRLERHHLGSLTKYRPELERRLTQLTANLVSTMERKLERLEESPDELDKTPLKDIALSIGIIGDKAAAAAGVATTIVEHRSGVSLDDAMKAIAEAKAKVANKITEGAIEAEIVG